MYTLDATGKRVYTLKKIAQGEVTKSAHPARFSPDDKYSRYVSLHRCSLMVHPLNTFTRDDQFIRFSLITGTGFIQAPSYFEETIWIAFDAAE